MPSDRELIKKAKDLWIGNYPIGISPLYDGFDAAIRVIADLEERESRLQVQLAGCDVAALGGTNEPATARGEELARAVLENPRAIEDELGLKIIGLALEVLGEK